MIKMAPCFIHHFIYNGTNVVLMFVLQSIWNNFGIMSHGVEGVCKSFLDACAMFLNSCMRENLVCNFSCFDLVLSPMTECAKTDKDTVMNNIKIVNVLSVHNIQIG